MPLLSPLSILRTLLVCSPHGQLLEPPGSDKSRVGNVKMGVAVQIEKGATIGNGVDLKNGCKICAGATVKENASIGPGTTIGPSAVIGAGTKIANSVQVDDNASIGENATIGTGEWRSVNAALAHPLGFVRCLLFVCGSVPP